MSAPLSGDKEETLDPELERIRLFRGPAPDRVFFRLWGAEEPFMSARQLWTIPGESMSLQNVQNAGIGSMEFKEVTLE